MEAAENTPLGRIAVLIPCYNEALTIGAVVRDFRQQLPQAAVVVFDNNSTDDTAMLARAAGAQVHWERRQGKGYVIQSMFRQVEADIYVIVDGDGTYPANAVHKLLEPIRTKEAEMVIGSRLQVGSASEFKPLNRFGNYMYLFVLKVLFGVRISDLLSGYRSFSRRVVKSLPLSAGGFQTEVEITIKSLERGFSIVEVPVALGSRPPGSSSKIRIVRDGLLILSSMLGLFRDYKPLTFFGGLGGLLTLLALIPGISVVSEVARNRLVSSQPYAILAVGLVLAGLVLIVAGLVLHSVASRFQELDQRLDSIMAEIGHDRYSGSSHASVVRP
jgi:glycosyltransferase involved in cell wall biosynthesis